MNVLQLALAIAVSMLIFSTIASIVVEMIHKLLRTRSKGLKMMLQDLYESEIKQRLNAILKREGAAIEDLPKFIEKITLKSADPNVTTMEFVRRLAETEIGKRIARRTDNEVDVLIDEMVEQYEEYGRRSSQLFRQYSQIGTVAVSIIIAFCLNINILVIFQTFQKNEKLTRTVAFQSKQVMATYQIQAELLKTTLQEADSDGAGLNAGIEDLKAGIQRVRKAAADAEQLGLPIGWSDDKMFNRKDIDELGLIFWIITTTLTGFLIGLGGPFWFDVVKRLTPVAQLTGALVRQPPAKDDTGKGTILKKGAAAVIPDDHRTAFKTVINANRIIDNMEKDVDGNGSLGPKAIRL
jgi:hypothetical protein